MLSRIFNISPNSDFKQSSAKLRSRKYNQDKLFAAQESHDSFDFSPATVFLKQVNWKLSDLKYFKDEKIIISFYLDDYHFRTEINFQNLRNTNTLNYEVSYKKNTSRKKLDLIANFDVNLDGITKDESPLPVKFFYIHLLFNRFVDMDINDELRNDQSSGILSQLIEGLQSGIKQEFDLINNSLFTFAEKYSGLNIISQLPKNCQTGEIIINYIKSFDVGHHET